MSQTKLYRPTDSKVTIYDNNGSLLLRFRHFSHSYNLSIGLLNTPKNLKIAEKKCLQITQDITFNNFDPEKYGLNKKERVVDDYLTTTREVLNFYSHFKPDLDSSTLESICILNKWLDKSPSECQSLLELDRFLMYLKTGVSHGNSVKKGYSDKYIGVHFRILKSAINLAFSLNKIKDKTNISKLYSLLNTRKEKEVKVYSKEEIKCIIDYSYEFFDYLI